MQWLAARTTFKMNRGLYGNQDAMLELGPEALHRWVDEENYKAGYRRKDSSGYDTPAGQFEDFAVNKYGRPLTEDERAAIRKADESGAFEKMRDLHDLTKLTEEQTALLRQLVNLLGGGAPAHAGPAVVGNVNER
jgi:hypothetical protein